MQLGFPDWLWTFMGVALSGHVKKGAHRHRHTETKSLVGKELRNQPKQIDVLNI